MRVPRIFHPAPLGAGLTVELEESAANHVARVLRLRPGAPLILFDGSGGEYAATLGAVGKRNVTVELGAHDAREVESPLAITLAQGIAKGERMDYVVQKAVELGVSRIVPLLTEHCAVRLDAERLEKRQRHWQAIAIGACEQSGRNRVPAVAAPLPLAQWLEQESTEPGLILDPRAAGGIEVLPPPQEGVRLLIGPEGGLSDAEVALARSKGFQGIRLGPRILRTETAALTALAIVQARWGDL